MVNLSIGLSLFIFWIELENLVMRCCYKREWRKVRWRVRERVMGFGQEGVKKINGFVWIWLELAFRGGTVQWREEVGMVARLRSSPCTCNEGLRKREDCRAGELERADLWRICGVCYFFDKWSTTKKGSRFYGPLGFLGEISSGILIFVII